MRYELAAIWILSALGCSAARAPEDQIRKAAEKAVALLQVTQKDWKEQCDSCHQQSLPSIAFETAREHGVAVDETLAHASNARAYSYFADVDRAVQYTHVIDPAMADGMAIEGAFSSGVQPSLVTAVYARLLASRQKPDGHWVTFDVRAPQAYSPVTATAVALRAIQLYSHPSLAADVGARAARARRWLAAVHPRDTEESTMQILGLLEAGAAKGELAPLAATLLAAQQPDGGWRGVPTRPSDAYSTGEVLTALHLAGVLAIDSPAWRKGIQFLLRTQAEDGSWHVVSRVEPPAPVNPVYFETGYPYGHDQFISAMGASWAVRALSIALGPPAKLKKTVLREAAPVGAKPWMETMLFGSAAEVRALIARGFDVNSATAGGTTALMMAMPDLEKAKLLLAHGAKVNARAASKYSALMVAAQYPDSAPVMRLLLDHGAQVELPKSEAPAMFNATPLALAAIAGNAAMFPRLIAGGNRIESPMLMLGIFPQTALQTAVFFRDPDSARVLLDRVLLEHAAPVDLPDSDGLTALDWAAIGNSTKLTVLLIEHGAQVNHVDKKGMTPLLYAASIGFGDAGVAEVLLAAGANANAKTKEGLTAADLVKKYRHAQLYRIFHVGL